MACVPLANALGLLASRQRLVRVLPLAVFLNGVALTLSLLYALVFLPLLPLSLIAILFMGLGLLPLAPLTSFITALIVRRRLRQTAPRGTPMAKPWLGMGIGAAALLAASTPSLVTRVGLQYAVNGPPEAQRLGLKWLRWMGSEELLRGACYIPIGHNSMLPFTESVSTDEARVVYYRVTGQTFNTLPKPEHLRSDGFFRWGDDEQGGLFVGGRVPGLSLASSELKGSVDGDAALAYLEWTMSFATTAEGQSEARTQVALPPGAVVSRVTLFIDGQEREAAFAATGKAREAYEKVVQTRRDPLLVTQQGPDRIQVQCFPVVKGPPMKIKLGFTVPLIPRDEGRAAALLLPTLAERNFHIEKGLRHVVRVESRRPLLAPPSGSLEHRPDGVSEWLTALDDEALSPPQAVLTVQRKGAAATAWTEDLLDAREYIVRQELRQTPVALPARVILVVDGSGNMKEALPEIAQALSFFPRGSELSILASLDEVEELLPPGPVDEATLQRVAERVRQLPVVGGQDANSALSRAWSQRAAQGRTAVVWIHGPQPLPPFAQWAGTPAWMISPAPEEFLDVRVGEGPNPLAVELSKRVPFRTVPRLGPLGQDLRELFTSWGSPAPGFHRERLHVAGWEPPPDAWKTSSHLARLWAHNEVTRLTSTASPEAETQARDWAIRHQLVTGLTGAVVLERMQQYEEAGLRPVEPGTVPTVPEPETWMLLAVACVLVAAFRWGRGG
ncbi:hypothetical protein STIAU_8812 [Stigmatella aurantiaca DW4/3-1]|uniref:VIT domain-containing protein n=1 Tax=Stigmatella aurantiaca (strain DW4/3-1) TaxID=378806 RepID=Q09A47_STIAD|nr:hypothetical protein STIAU_8812 [Stigmatella aurantiaca DW4/3-1]